MSSSTQNRTGPNRRSSRMRVAGVLLAFAASWHGVQAQTSSMARDLHLRSDLPYSTRPALAWPSGKSSTTTVASAGRPVETPGPAAPTQNQEPVRIWSVELADGTVRLCLKRWAHEAQWQLVWDADRDFVIEAEVRWQGTFEQALTALLESLRNSEFPLQARLNSDGRILRIQRLGPSPGK